MLTCTKNVVCGRFPWLEPVLARWIHVFVALCPEAPKGSADSGSDFKASQKTGPRLKVSPDRLE